jgi:zinc protease
MRRPALLLRALFAGAALPALAAAQAPAARPAAPAARAAAPTPGAAARATRVASVEGITEYRLPNGLRVLLFPDASQPTATVNITYFVGSAREGYGETGMAHLLEHLVFKGTPRHPNIPQELTSHGARPNGTTWYDRTNYFETVPAIDTTIAWALDLEADRMVNSHIAKKDLESEFSVVRNEFEMGENSPFRVLLERAMSSAFLWHGYGRSTIGNRSDIEKVPIDRLQAFYRKYYQPDNAMLVVAGKFDEARMLQLVEEKFGRIPRPARTLDPSWTLEPTQDGERMVALRRVGDVQLASATYHVPAGAHPDFAAVAVLTEVLGSNPAGRLYKALIESKKAASAAAFAFQLREPGMLYAYTQVRRDDSLAVAQQALLGALDGVVTTPPTADEVARARTTLLKNWELTFNNAERVALQLSEWAANGDWRLIFLHRDRLEKVTPADVQRVAAAYLKPANRTVAVFVPTDKPDRAEIPPAPDVGLMVDGYKGRAAVAAGEVFDPSPANVDARTQRSTLPSGLKLALVPKTTRGNVVVASLTLRLGDERSLAGRAPAGEMLGAMLARGTRTLTRQQFRDSLDRLKARVNVGGNATAAYASVETVREMLPAALRLVAQAVREPALDARELDLLRSERLASLEEQRSEPTALAQVAYQRVMNPRPRAHPQYVGTLDEQVADVRGRHAADVRRFHTDFYGAGAGELTVVGDFDAPPCARSRPSCSAAGSRPRRSRASPSRIPPCRRAPRRSRRPTRPTPSGWRG